MGERHRAEFHWRREAQELKQAWQAASAEARRLHLELANHHRVVGITCLLAREENAA